MIQLLRRLFSPWRRSLQLRVVTSTVALGVLGVSLIGAYLFQQVADGLTEDRVQTARLEAQVLAARAQSNFDSSAASADTAEFNNVAGDVVASIAPPPNDLSRYVVFMRAAGNTSAVRLDTVLSGGLRTSPIPGALRAAVSLDSDRQQVTIIDLDRSALVGEVGSAAWARSAQ